MEDPTNNSGNDGDYAVVEEGTQQRAKEDVYYDIVDVLKTEEPFYLTTNFPTKHKSFPWKRIALINIALFIIVLCAGAGYLGWKLLLDRQHPSYTEETSFSVNQTTTIQHIFPDTITLLPSDDTTLLASDDTTLLPSDNITMTQSDDTTMPPSDDTTMPPSDHTTMPPSDHTTMPPSDHTTMPPSDDTTMPPSDHTTMPPSDDTTMPPSDHTTMPPSAKDCYDLKSQSSVTTSGVYNITIATNTPYQRQIEVYCDMDTDGGGWSVLLKRQDGSVHFEDLSWDEYKKGFGNIDGEYYIGNDNMHLLTMKNHRSYEIRIDLTSDYGIQAYAVYSSFMVDDEANSYKLYLGQHSGTLADKFSQNDQQPFSTYDRDNDSLDGTNCAEIHHGGWWFWGCSFSKLTAGYGPGGTLFDKMYWYRFNYTYISYADMKIRPI